MKLQYQVSHNAEHAYPVDRRTALCGRVYRDAKRDMQPRPRYRLCKICEKVRASFARSFKK